MTEHISRKRINKMIGIFLVMAAFSIILGIGKGMLTDHLLCIIVLDLVFFTVLAFLLEHQRLEGRLCKNKATDYTCVLIGVILASVTAGISGFLPEFTKPVLLIAVVLTGFCSEWIGLCISIYYCMILAAACQMSTNELISYLILILACSMLSAGWENAKWKKKFILMLCCLQTIIPVLFYYLEYHQNQLHILLISWLLGIVWMIIFQFVYDQIRQYREQEVKNLLRDMLKEEYSAAKELRQFSVKEYKHAQLVSKAAKKCARIAGADEMLCAVSGFYYRIGVLRGETIAENGELLAANLCFPEKVYQIIKEYHGVLELPSTPESAIVQMVDGVLCSIEQMQAGENIHSWNEDINKWNKDMVIYHTLTEFSSNGMYNQSGLSMHKFFEIREYLLKEDSLL